MAQRSRVAPTERTKRWLRRRIRPIAVRDQRLADQQQLLRRLESTNRDQRRRLTELTDELQKARRNPAPGATGTGNQPSFSHLLLALRQQASVSVRRDPLAQTPFMQIPYKLRNYRLAQSHGVAVPRVLGAWASIEEISGLEQLPERFVLKSDGGAGSSGVFLLEHSGTGSYRTVGGTQSFSQAKLRQHLAGLDPRRVRPPFFAEAFLDTFPTRDAPSVGTAIPEDVKIYASYGRILQVMVRRVGQHGAPSSIRTRFLAADGTDLGPVALDRRGDDQLPVPHWLPEMVEAARHLSRVVGLGFCRVDLYDGANGPILGEITRAPGGAQRYRQDHDRWMGEQWLRGALDLARDLSEGRPYGVLHGDRPATNHYPAGHVSRSGEPGAWEPHVVPCAQWCGERATPPRL